MVALTESRDLPLCPRAKVYKGLDTWSWKHWCPWHSHFVAHGGYQHWEMAQLAAEQHMKHCEAS